MFLEIFLVGISILLVIISLNYRSYINQKESEKVRLDDVLVYMKITDGEEVTREYTNVFVEYESEGIYMQDEKNVFFIPFSEIKEMIITKGDS